MKTLRNEGALIILSLMISACQLDRELVTGRNNESDSLIIKNLVPISNLSAGENGIKSIEVDYEGALDAGFVIPSKNQLNGDGFIFSFDIKNKGKADATFSYKLYYQNESYKFPETIENTSEENPLSAENFYGSWENTDRSNVKTIKVPADDLFHTITDTIRIAGNPRNEKRYYSGDINNRWKRNARTGLYSFLLVATTDQNVSNGSIPPYVTDITKQKEGVHVNPYYYFLHSGECAAKNVCYIMADSALQVRAKPDLGGGIFINPENFKKEKFSQYFSENCGQESDLSQNAAFEQFINYVDPSMVFENIPVVRDVTSDEYTITDYNWNLAFYKRDELISTLPSVANTPCQTIYSDSTSKKIVLRNPATKEGVWRKESVGVRTRHGFTYGKYRLKCKLAPLLNKKNVWNGLTNAIWLLNQQNGAEWNNRRACDKKGYMASYWGGDNDERVSLTDYSEIDFEIIKTYPYCPDDMFPPVIKTPIGDQSDIEKWNIDFPDEIRNHQGDISVTCTNWDMACWDPDSFGSGCNSTMYQGMEIPCHRWSENYRALHERSYQSNEELFGGDYYYFEIDWRPREIIWRIGPTPDKMRVVGYMNDHHTSIPNNQMTLIVTQEYHTTKWWPGSPFIQDNTPFPSKDIIGEIYELVIE